MNRPIRLLKPGRSIYITPVRQPQQKMNHILGWLESANSGRFLVYNETADMEGRTFGVNNRCFVVKYSRVIDVLN